MRDWQKELDELREQMAQRQDDIAVYENLSLQEKKCKQEVDSRMTKWAREERDVEKLEKLIAAWKAEGYEFGTLGELFAE